MFRTARAADSRSRCRSIRSLPQVQNRRNATARQSMTYGEQKTKLHALTSESGRRSVRLAGASTTHLSTTHFDTLLESRYRAPRMPTRPERDRLELLQGTLDLLILRTLRLAPP